MMFDSESFDRLISELSEAERKVLHETLELLDVIIEDFASTKTQNALQFRLASESEHFIFYIGQLIEINTGHGVDYISAIKEFPQMMGSDTSLIHDSDLIEPTSKVELIQANSVIVRSAEVAIRRLAESEFYNEATTEILNGLMSEFRQIISRVMILHNAVLGIAANAYVVLADETLPLLIETLLRETGYLEDVLARIDEFVTPDETKLTPIDEPFGEPNDE